MISKKLYHILFFVMLSLASPALLLSQTPDWSYTNTGISHNFYFPVDIIICSNDSIEIGDYIGIFYDSLGTFSCAGYMIWNGGNQTLIAYGDDTLTTAKEGFAIEEEAWWKTFHVAANLEYFHTAFFAHDGFYPDSNRFVVNGASKLLYMGNCVAPVFQINIEGTSCLGDTDGSAWVEVLSMNPPYTYLWSDGTVNDSIIDKSAGYYTVSVANVLGYVTTETVFIPSPDSLEINHISYPVTQPGLPNGSIDLTITGGTSPYFFQWNNGAFSEDLTNIFTGYYYVTVTDSHLCENFDSIQVTTSIPAPWTVLPTSISHEIIIPEHTPVVYNGNYIKNNDEIGVFYDSVGVLKCAGKYVYIDGFGTTGTQLIVYGDENTTLEVEGFTTGQEFNWKIWDSSSGAEFDVMASYIDSVIWPDGGHFVGNGKSAVKALNDVEHDMGISAFINPTDYCNLSNAEPIILEIFSNGMAQENAFILKYNINGGPILTEPVFQIINYLDTVQHEMAFPANLEAEIDYHIKAFIELTDDTNPHNDTTELFLSPIKITITTVPDTLGNCIGMAALQVTGGTPPYTIQWNDPNNQTGPIATNLCPGFYNAVITDTSNCEVLRIIEIENTLPPAYSSIVGDISCYGEADGFINISMTSFVLPLSFGWSNGSFSEDLSNIGPGTYYVTINDGTTLAVVDSFTIIEPDSLEISYLSEDVDCYGDASGSIDIDVSGGQSPYVYNWSDGLTQPDLYNLTAGNYIVSVTDSHLCLTTQYVQISQPPKLVVNLIVTDISTAGADDGSIFLSLFGATPPYSFQWNTGSIDQNLSQLDEGYYSLTISDAFSCDSLIDSIFVSEPLPVISGNIFMGPNLSPDGVAVLYREFQNQEIVAIDYEITNNGHFSFSVAPDGKYLIYALPNPDYGFNVYPHYIPTYFSQGIYWDYSTRIETETNYANADIYLDSNEEVFFGSATISGNISYTNPSVYESNIYDNSWFSKKPDQKSILVNPARNITLLLLDEDDNPVKFSLSQFDGTFQFTNIEYGDFTLMAEKAGFQSDVVPVSLSEGNSEKSGIELFIVESAIVIGMEELNASIIESITVFPNPVGALMSVQLPSKIRKITGLNIYDCSGQKKITVSGNEIVSKCIFTINSEKITPGIYFLIIDTENNGAFKTKFIKL